jgi:hypothetical protein
MSHCMLFSARPVLLVSAVKFSGGLIGSLGNVNGGEGSLSNDMLVIDTATANLVELAVRQFSLPELSKQGRSERSARRPSCHVADSRRNTHHGSRNTAGAVLGVCASRQR